MERRVVAYLCILTVFTSIVLINMSSFLHTIGNKLTGFVTKVIHSGVNYDNPNPLKDIPELRELQLMDLIDLSHCKATSVAMYSYEYNPATERVPWHSRLYACVLTLVDNRKYCIHKFPEDMNRLMKPEAAAKSPAAAAAAAEARCHEMEIGGASTCKSFPVVERAKSTDDETALELEKGWQELVDVSDSGSLAQHSMHTTTSGASDHKESCKDAEKEQEVGRVVVLEWMGQPKGWMLEREKEVSRSTLAEFVKVCGDKFDAQKDWSKQAAERMMELE